MKKWRLNLIFIFILLFSAAVIGRLIYIQILKHSYYEALAQGQQKFFIEVQGDRGDILSEDQDQTQHILASNKISYLCYVSPQEITNDSETADVLTKILNLEKNLILENIAKKEIFYQVIKKNLNEEEKNALKQTNLAGVYIGEEIKRYYPNDYLAANLIGFLGGEGIGQYGIEGYWNDILEGKKGFIEKGRGPLGFLISPLSQEKIGIKKGSDLVLTIDYNIQFMAEKLLKKAKENLDIEDGEIIVSDPTTGKIIALAHFPGFNSNEYSKEKDLAVFQNSAIQKIFEPGSIFKPITMATGLEEGKFTPESKYIDEGELQIGGYKIYNYGGRVWGEMSMTEVLKNSINTGAVWAERQIGQKTFLEYIEKFGFFKPTGIELEEEIFSENKNLKKGYEINFATASFGQGVEVTSIQLIRAFSALANGGKLVKPYIVKKIISSDGEIKEISPEIGERVISEKTSSQIKTMLVSVVENGFAKRAQIPGYYIAGKTGTAQISWSALEINKSGYSQKTIQSFIGFAPAFNPRFLILIKLNNPKAKTAEYSAVPIFRDLAKYIVDYWQIPPDYE